jgi:septum formation protein
MTVPVLASGSVVRARLLSAAGLNFEVIPANVDETALKQEFLAQHADPASIALMLADRKAEAVSTFLPGRLVIGADQILECDGVILSKAPDLGQARRQLLALAGREHRLLSAVVLARDGRMVWRHLETVRLVMRAFSAAFLDTYLATEGDVVLDSVGCYHLEGRGAQLFAGLDGDYFAALGLPLFALLEALRRLGALES